MPVPTPFHPRTSALCTSLLWKDWAGTYAVRSYDTYPEREYFAIRHTAALIDVSGLYKYDLRGPGALDLLARVMARNVRKLEPGQVAYGCWCDDAGKVIDDGTVSFLDEGLYRVTAAEPNFHWLSRYARGLEVEITDRTRGMGALSVQGPCSRDLLAGLAEGVGDLRYFRVTRARIAGKEVWISRTGYTGDLGFEIWVEQADAVAVYDAVLEAGRPHGALPVGLDAMDVSRIEAGYIMNGVDYYSANHALIESRKSTPYELGLGWTVALKRAPFNGQAALREEKRRGPERVLVGLALDWNEFEAHFAARRLPPEVPSAAWRSPVPVYDGGGKQIGQATSGAWSPVLKKNLALATVTAAHAAPGTRLRFEVMVEYERKTVAATVVEKPFYDPERKRSGR